MSYSPFDLSGKVVAVVGGNSGIGLSMAEALAQSGATVVIGGRSEQSNRAAVDGIAAAGGTAVAIALDVTQEASIVAFMQQLVDRYGRIDACFANAGGNTPTPPFTEMSGEDWRRSLELNLDSTFYCFREAARHMIALGIAGSLVGTSSASAIQTTPGSNYAAAKAGILGLAVSLVRQLGRHGIRVNTIIPGLVETRLVTDALAKEKFATGMLKRMAVGRIGRPEDFGGIAVYLASDASAWHTGDTFVIDGGQTRT